MVSVSFVTNELEMLSNKSVILIEVLPEKKKLMKKLE